MDNNKKNQSKELTPEELKELSNFKKWLEDKKYSPKSLDEVKKLYAQYQKEKKKPKNLHGAKLDYIKTLKHQCADDEELVYYKVGGKVDCGCKKKENGGEIKKALNGTVAKFKNRTKAQLDKINKLSEKDYFNGTADHTKPGTSQKPILKFKTRSKSELDKINKLSEKDYFNGTADHTKPGTKKVSKKACGSKIKKDCNGAVIKFKMHRLGGSLNRIPFMLKGTNKKGLQWKTAYPPDYIENGLPKYIEKPNYVVDWRGDKKYLVNPYSGMLMTPSEDYLVRDIEEAIEEGTPMGGYDATYHLKDDYHHNDPNRIKVSGLVANLVENRGSGYIPGTEWDDMGRRLVYNWQKKKNIKPKFLYSR